VRGRNTENRVIEEVGKVAEYLGKRHVIIKFLHEEKHIVLQDIEKGRRKKEILDGVRVFVAIVA
jgi:hypothetical protein